MFETLAGTLLRFVQEWGEAAIFLVILLEEAGLPLPLPGDLVLIWGGYRVTAGESNLLTVILAVEAASLIGASTLYWLASKGGRPLLLRYGRFIHVSEEKLQRAEAWVGRNAAQAVVLGRIVPGFRIATPIAAGVFRVPYRIFLPSLAAGALVYGTFWVMVGVWFGPSVIEVLHAPRLTARLILSLAWLVAMGLLTWQIHRRVLPSRRGAAFHISRGRQIEAALLAGLLAWLEMATALGAILIGLEELHIDLPGHALLTVIARVGAAPDTLLKVAFLPVAITLFFLGGIGWGVVYALWFEPLFRAIPDWLKGTIFSLLPTLVSWLVVLPLLGAGPLGLGLQAGFVPAAGELLRHLIYGAALGLAYPMLLLARRPWEAKAAAEPAAD